MDTYSPWPLREDFHRRTTRDPAATTVRLRLVGTNWFSDLVGPTRCGVIDPLVRSELFARLGPDPLREDADPGRAWARISTSRQPIGALLMDQAVVAGIGNVYRAELLFRARIDPYREGRRVSESEWGAMWRDLRTLMRAGVKAQSHCDHLAEAPLASHREECVLTMRCMSIDDIGSRAGCVARP